MSFRPYLFAGLSIVLAGCIENPATGGSMLSLSSPAEQREIGDITALSHLKAEGLYRPGSPLAVYVTNLCNQIYAVTEAASEPVQCNLSDDGGFNAFATPGYLFVQRGLLPFMSSEDELAAVLGHEAGHLTARHVARSITRARATQMLLLTGAVALGAGGADPVTMQSVNSMGGTAGELGMAHFSRSHETEADAIARRYLQKAGYNPAATVTMARSLFNHGQYVALQSTSFENEDESFLDRLKASHPSSPERIAAGLAATGEPPAIPPEEDTARQRYMNAINGMAWGPQRRYGIARKNELVLTRQRTVIPFPKGTTTKYLPSGHPRYLGTWMVAHPQSGVYVRINSIPVQSGASPASVVQKLLPGWHSKPERVIIGSGQQAQGTQSLDDLALSDTDDIVAKTDAAADAALDEAEMIAPAEVTGYTATYRYLNSSMRWRVVAFGAGTRANEMLVYTIIYPNEETMTREDANIMSVLKKVRFITRDQALKYKQLQIHTFHAAAGDSVARQASKMPIGTYQEELFRALNNLPDGTEMQTGQLYKTIIDLNP